jgi:hypothetical protein
VNGRRLTIGDGDAQEGPKRRKFRQLHGEVEEIFVSWSLEEECCTKLGLQNVNDGLFSGDK